MGRDKNLIGMPDIDGKSRPMKTAGGKEYFWHYSPPARKKAAASLVSVPVKTPVNFSFEKEKGFHRFAKKLGFATEYQTQNAEFDYGTYIFCDSPEFGERLRHDSRLRQAVTTLLLYGTPIKGDIKTGVLSMTLHTALPVMPPEVEETIVNALHDIAASVNMLSMQPIKNSALLYYLSVACTFFAIALTTAGVVMLVALPYQMAFTDFSYVLRSITVGSVATLALLFLLQKLFSKSSYGVKALLVFLVIGLPGIYLASFNSLYYVNYHYDQSEPVVRRELVVEKYITYHGKKRTPHYNIAVSNWHEGKEPLRQAIDYQTYQRITPGTSRVLLKTHPGYLGYEWIESYEVLP